MDVSDPLPESIETEEHDASSVESESSDGGDLTDEQIESTIRLLKRVVETTPKDYQSRVQLIGLLRQQGDLEEATEHRETLATLFPLGESTYCTDCSSFAPQRVHTDLSLAFSGTPRSFTCFLLVQMSGSSGLTTNRLFLLRVAKR